MTKKFSTRNRLKSRPDLIGEHKISDAGQLVLACLFGAVWTLDTCVFQAATFLNRYIPPLIRIPAAIILFALSAFLAGRGLSIVFGETRKKPCVIRKSVFGIIRHPIYLSEILLYSGFLMLSFSLAAAAVLVAAVIFLHRISRYEEKLLLERFKEDYREYMEGVPMWIPRLRRK